MPNTNMVFNHFPNHFIDPDPDPDPDPRSSSTTSLAYSYGAPSPHSAIFPYPPPPSRSLTMPSSLTNPDHPLPTLTSPFPSPLPPPPNLQIRLRSQSLVHASLDAALAAKEEEEGLPPIMDQDRMVGKGRFEAQEGKDELNVRMARRALDDFGDNRMPYVELAGQTLQAVVGEKNVLDFELPKVPLNMTPSFNRIASTPSGPNNNNRCDRPKDAAQQRSPLSPISPLGFDQVDEKTGKGLREWLLSRGKETGTQRKRECRSISFHDFTTDMRSGIYANELVAHYNGGGLHERADVYEVDLPTTYTDPTTKLLTQGTQTWLWFLISRPAITLSPTETSTTPSDWSVSNYGPLPPTTIRPPPDFPMPIPTSYVVFTCPASNVTEYPDCKDDTAPQEASTRPKSSSSYKSSFPPPYLISRARPPSTTTIPLKKIYKRKDYDFSFQGTPLFEFSSAETFCTPNRDRIEFLSVDNLGSWCPSDGSGMCDLQEWQARLRKWKTEVADLGHGQLKKDERVYRDRSLEAPHPNRGLWWDKFYEKLWKEEGKWKRIRDCMGRGKCRIVVRWVESEPSPALSSSRSSKTAMRSNSTSPSLGLGGPRFSSGDGTDADGDSDMSEVDAYSPDSGLGIGLGVHLNGNGALRSDRDGKKIKERIAGRRNRALSGTAGVGLGAGSSGGGLAAQGNGPGIVTKAEARRRSGLGVFSTSLETVIGSGVLIGIGMEGSDAAGGGGIKTAGGGTGSKSGVVAGEAGGGGVGDSKDKRRKK